MNQALSQVTRPIASCQRIMTDPGSYKGQATWGRGFNCIMKVMFSLTLLIAVTARAHASFWSLEDFEFLKRDDKVPPSEANGDKAPPVTVGGWGVDYKGPASDYLASQTPKASNAIQQSYVPYGCWGNINLRTDGSKEKAENVLESKQPHFRGCWGDFNLETSARKDKAESALESRQPQFRGCYDVNLGGDANASTK